MTVAVDVERRYPTARHARTHRPPKLSPHSAYRDCLRREFSFACVYCLAREYEVATGESWGGFEVEHFRPKGNARFRHLRNDYKNLLWACHACNRAKLDTWPVRREEKLGFHFVDPTQAGLGDYLRIAVDEVIPVDAGPAGQYMIDELNLNSALHRKRRQDRREILNRLAVLEASAAVLRARASADLLDELNRVEAELRACADILLPHEPWDAPNACECPPST